MPSARRPIVRLLASPLLWFWLAVVAILALMLVASVRGEGHAATERRSDGATEGPRHEGTEAAP